MRVFSMSTRTLPSRWTQRSTISLRSNRKAEFSSRSHKNLRHLRLPVWRQSMKQVLAALLLMGASNALHATILLQQPPVWNGNGAQVGDGYTNEESSANTGFQTFDN